MKKNNTLKIAGVALIIWFLLKRKKTTEAGGGQTAPTATAPTSAQTRVKQLVKNSLINKKIKDEVNGVII